MGTISMYSDKSSLSTEQLTPLKWVPLACTVTKAVCLLNSRHVLKKKKGTISMPSDKSTEEQRICPAGLTAQVVLWLRMRLRSSSSLWCLILTVNSSHISIQFLKEKNNNNKKQQQQQQPKTTTPAPLMWMFKAFRLTVV